MRSLIVIFFQVIIICLSFGQSDDLRIEIDKIIRFDTEISFKKTPGFIVGIIDNDSSYYFSFGRKTKNENDSLGKHDIFEVGSVTKVFTSRIIEILKSKNLLHYDDVVNNYLPSEFQNPRLENITISDLVNHTSGLPKRPSFFGKKEKNFQNPYELYSTNDLLAFYRDFIPYKKKFEYSHTNYALLEVIIENITDKKYHDVLQEEISLPLGMKNTFVDFPEQKNDLITPGYDRALKKTTPWTFNSFKASEGVKTSPNNMMLFIKEKLKKSYVNSAEIVKESVVDSLKGKGLNERLGLDNGWHTIDMKSFNIVTHTGKTSGHNAFVALIKETKTAVIIFANSSIGTEDLGLQILRMINYNWRRIPNI